MRKITTTGFVFRENHGRLQSGAAAWLSLIALMANPIFLAGHGDLHDRITALDEQIKREPKKVELYVARGELHSTHGDWDKALADYDQASILDPERIIVELARGQVLLAAGNYESARAALDRYLSKKPDDSAALVTRARTLAKLGRSAEAVHDYSKAIKEMAQPPPEYYLERARVLAEQGKHDEAVRGIDEGASKVGRLLVLQLYVIDLLVQEKRYDDALGRLDPIIAQSPRKESWLARRGEILQQAGRKKEATKAYAEALQSLASLPSYRRGGKAMQDLEASVKSRLSQLEREAVASTQP